MATNYPGALDSLTNPSAGDALTSPSHSAQHANANDAIEAVQTELGVNPAGIYDTVAERLAAVDDRVLDGTISDVDINAAADIGRSKIAGTALTSDSMGVFSVLDYGAAGDGTTDDTAAVQALLDGLVGPTGGRVLFPGRRTYRIDGTIRIGSYRTIEVSAGAVCKRFSSLSAETAPLFQIAGQLHSRLIGDGEIVTENASPNGVVAMGPISKTDASTPVYAAALKGVTLIGVRDTGNVGLQLKSSFEEHAVGMYENVISDLRIREVAVGVSISDGANSNHFRNLCFFDISETTGTNSGGVVYDFYGNGVGTGGGDESCAENLVLGGFVDHSNDATVIRMRSAMYNQIIGLTAEPGGTDPWPGRPWDLDADSHNNYISMMSLMYQDGVDLGADNTIFMNGLLRVPSLHIGAARELTGSGTPEGTVAAPVGSTFRRLDGGAGTAFYVKESGAATSSGWVAKGGTGPTAFEIGTVGSGSAGVTLAGDETDGYVLNFVLPTTPVGNLLTANMASVETDTTGFASPYNCTLSRDTAQYLDGAASLKMEYGAGTSGCMARTAETTSVAAGVTYTAQAAVRTDQSTMSVSVSIMWYTSGYAYISQTDQTITATDAGWVTGQVTAVAPATAARAAVAITGPSGARTGQIIWADRLGLWAGAGGKWAMPGASIQNLGIRADPSDTAKVQIWNPVTSAWVTV